MVTATEVFDLEAAPMRIGTVTLKVRDLGKVSDFYRQVLGLQPLAEQSGSVTLGSATRSLLRLVGDAGLGPRDRSAAGLFHTAFRMPGRPDLARWLAFILQHGTRVHAASDHNVSEAIYLADPEGNGIEVYADRPTADWRTPDGDIHMTTEPLSVQDLLAASGNSHWDGFPEDGLVGHVHLQVGDTEEAERFYCDVLGFNVMTRYPGASFFGSGGYHHQLAGNVWNSRGATARPETLAGLGDFSLVLRSPDDRAAIVDRAERAGIAVSPEDGAPTLRDPWGISIRLEH